MRAYETEVQKLQEVHDEFLLLHGEGENGAANAAITATATAAGATKKQVGNDDEEEEGEVVEESKK
jgi:ribosomal protein L12E/L44/L45/RPP1/RPP2